MLQDLSDMLTRIRDAVINKSEEVEGLYAY